MADDAVESMEEGPAKNPNRRKNLLVVGILFGVMLAEGVMVFVLAKHFGAQPATAEAGAIDGINPDEGQRKPEEVEVEVARFRAQNERARQVAVFDLVVYATVHKENQERFSQLIEQKKATIQDRFSSVIRSADPQVLNEPDPATLRQKFRQELAQIVGDDKMVLEVLIPSIVSYRES